MKAFASIVFLATVAGINALLDEDKALLDMVSKPCQARTGATQEMIEKVRKGKFIDDPKMKKQTLCVLQGFNMIDHHDEMQMDIIRRMLRRVTDSDEETKRMMDKCCTKKGTPEDTAFQMMKCIHQKKPKFSLIVHLDKEQKAVLRVACEDCQREAEVSEEVIHMAHHGEFLDDPKLKMHMFCMMRKMGMMDEDGEMMMDIIRPKVRRVCNTDEEAEEMMEECCRKMDTPEDTALAMMKCLMENRPNFHMIR